MPPPCQGKRAHNVPAGPTVVCSLLTVCRGTGLCESLCLGQSQEPSARGDGGHVSEGSTCKLSPTGSNNL
eukprot:scaffold26581_cov60-Phaeocystis_antarctica.AAC.3